jgi:hypothetical protein
MSSLTNNNAAVVTDRQMDLSYRRGVLLGMTMAEIMILLLFCMLMAFVIKLDDVELDQEKVERAERILIATGLNETEVEDDWQNIDLIGAIATGIGYERLREIFGNAESEPTNIDNVLNARIKAALDQYREVEGDLTAELGRNPTQSEVSAALTQKELEARKYSEFEKEIKALEQLQEGLRENESLTQAIATAEKIREQLSNAMDSAQGAAASNIEQVLRDAEAYNSLAGKDVQEELSRLLDENRELEGRLENVSTALDGAKKQLGNGLVYPSCFRNSNGRTQFVFEVEFDESSVVMQALAVPGNEDKKRVAPFGRISTGIKLSPAQFTEATKPLFDWSKQEECRFFVRIYDLTRPENKDVYKQMMKTVENHFYKYESEDKRVGFSI